jgi:hypothetical protein
VTRTRIRIPIPKEMHFFFLRFSSVFPMDVEEGPRRAGQRRGRPRADAALRARLAAVGRARAAASARRAAALDAARGLPGSAEAAAAEDRELALLLGLERELRDAAGWDAADAWLAEADADAALAAAHFGPPVCALCSAPRGPADAPTSLCPPCAAWLTSAGPW